MKHLLSIIALLLMAASAQAASPDVNVSVSIGQPGFYGQIDIGNAPRPRVIYAKPVAVRPAPAHVSAEPLYLHVPPGHAKHWSKHCSKYNACDRQVYFVKDNWYNKVYVPHYQSHRDYYEKRRHGGHGNKGDKHDNRDKHDRGHDNRDGGHGQGKH